MRSKEELARIFRTRGLRITPQRECVFEIMAGFEGRHPTAEDVWEAVCQRMPSVSLKTIYDILHELVSLGEVSKIEIGHGPSRFEPGAARHHHLLCTSCGRVESAGDKPRAPSLREGTMHGFQVTQVEVIFRGLCSDCRGLAGNAVAAEQVEA